MICRRIAFAASILGFLRVGYAQATDSGKFPVDDLGKAHELRLFAGQSLLILGTEDRRQMYGFEYAYSHPDKRLAIFGYPAQMVESIKVDFSKASGDFREPSSDLAVGAIFTAHYEWPWHSPRGFYFDWGGGAESVDHSSHDLPLSLNGAITAGWGYFFPACHNKILLGIRYFHISNAGRARPNFGQNQIQATIGFRY